MWQESCLVQQPNPLESTALDRLAGWLASFAENLTSQTSKQPGFPTPPEHFLTRQIELLKNHLELKMPRMFHDKLANRVIEALTQLSRKTRKINTHDIDRNRSQQTIIGRVMKILLTKNLTSLSIMNPHAAELFQDLLCSKAYMLTQLTHFEFLHPETLSETGVIQIIEKLHNLKYLRLHYVCTDNILTCLQENCKLIEELDLLSSSSITNMSVHILKQLRNLRTVNLNLTCVREKGITTLLMCCENLEYLHFHNDVTQAILRIAAYEENAEKTLKLKSYDTRGIMTLEQMQLVIKTCPLIQTMKCTKRKTSKNYLMALNDLHDLSDLKLIDYNFYEDQIKDLLRVKGHKLVQMHLDKVGQVDLNALKYICMFCPNLQSLTIVCNSLTQTSATDLSGAINIQPLRYLKRLTYIMNIDYYQVDSQPTNEILIFLLLNCPNVEFIDIRGTYSLTDSIMLDILDRNPKQLMHLKELRIRYKLSPLMMDRIVQNCINPPKVIQIELASLRCYFGRN